MLTPTDAYPVVGYQQQAYAVSQEGWYPPSGYYSNPPGMQVAPSMTTPQHSSHHMMVGGGYAPPHDGWNKHQTGGYAQPHDGWNKHQTSWHGSSDNYNHDYSSKHDGWNKHQTGWHGSSDNYSHGHNHSGMSHGGAAAHSGYGNYKEGHFPVEATKMKSVEYDTYGSSYVQQYPGQAYQKVEYCAVKGV